MTDKAEAIEIAQRIIDEENVNNGGATELAIGAIQEFAHVWVFHCNSREYLETGKFSSMLVGQGPMFISKNTGEVTYGVSAVSVEAQVEGDEILSAED